MIERLETLIFGTLDENSDLCRPSKASLSSMFHKINELVDHVNNLECSKSTETDTIPLTDAAKAFNEFGKEIGKEIFKEKEPQFGEWVSIAEKQPTKIGTYLFSFGSELCVVFYKAEIKEIEMPSGFSLSVDEAKHCPISIHWMPLPEPPKKEGMHQ